MPVIDTKASTFGLHHSLIIPIGARSRKSIEQFVGPVEQVFGNDEAFLVSFEPHGLPNDLPVWKHERSLLLNHTKQLWVDINSRKYRNIYYTVWEDMVKEKEYVIDHIMNRKLARALAYKYVRLLHVSRKTNSSSGRGGETVAMNFLPLSISVNTEINASEIVYADPMDLLKMLDIQVGGFGLDAVRDNHHLFYG
jgi:hypothetical protein